MVPLTFPGAKVDNLYASVFCVVESVGRLSIVDTLLGTMRFSRQTGHTLRTAALKRSLLQAYTRGLIDDEQHMTVKHNSTASLLDESTMSSIVMGKKLIMNVPTINAAVFEALLSNAMAASLWL